MAVDEEARREIFRKLEATFGAKVAKDMMEHLPSGGALAVATKADLDALEKRLDSRFEVLEYKLQGQISEVRVEVHRSTRNVVLSMTPIVLALNGAMFAALKLT